MHISLTKPCAPPWWPSLDHTRSQCYPYQITSSDFVLQLFWGEMWNDLANFLRGQARRLNNDVIVLTFLTEWSSGQHTMLWFFYFGNLIHWKFSKKVTRSDANFFEASSVNEVQFQQVTISLEMVEESKGDSEKRDENRKVTRKGMRLVPIKLPDGTTRNFYRKDLFRTSRMSYE